MDASPDTRPDPGSRRPAQSRADDQPHRSFDQPPEIRRPLDISVTADGHTAARARRGFTAWLAVDLTAGELFDDLVLAVYEALANAADHAYTAAAPGPVRLLARRTRDDIHITVADRGTWRDAPAADAFRGRGLPLIRRLIHDVHLTTGPTGTTLHLRAPLPPPGDGPG